MGKNNKKIFSFLVIIISIIGIIYGVSSLCKDFYSETVTNVSMDKNKQTFEELKNILFISSYSSTFFSVPKQKEGIFEALPANYANIDAIYMDSRRYFDIEYEKLFLKEMEYKMKNHQHYDAIIVGDDTALHFVEKYQEKLFGSIPIVFFCINDFETAKKASENPFITGCSEKYSLFELLNTAVKLSPTAKNFVAIYDSTVSGIGDQQQFFSMKRYFPSYNFRGINTSEIDFDELVKELKNISSENDILIHMSATEGLYGKHYLPLDIVMIILRYTKAPVYTTVDSDGVFEGLVGGYVFDFKEAGKEAGSIVKEILSGRPISDIPLKELNSFLKYFNYKTLKKYNLDESLLPSDVIFIDKEKSFWTLYGRVLFPALIVFVSFIFLIIIVIGEYRKISNYVEQLKKSRRQLSFSAEHDFLTKLPNRHAAHKELKRFINRAVDFSILLVDVDNFKSINDLFSHACGDFVLSEMSSRMLKFMEAGSFFVSRFGGDEFLLIYKKGYLTNDNEDLLNLQKALSEEISTEERKLNVKTSIGIADYNTSIKSVDELVAHVDFALYVAKQNGKNRFEFFNSEMKAEIQKAKQITEIIENAFVNDGFKVVYQPQVYADTGKIHGYEALVRLKCSDISPSIFIPVAEKNGYIDKIGRIVTEKVVLQLVEWRNQDIPLYPISINYSSNQMGDVEYTTYLGKLLKDYDIDPSFVKIEITESLYMKNDKQAMNLFEHFRDMGIKLALDDFGTGFSSLHYLTYLPVDVVKIDKTMTDTYLQDGKEEFIENIVNLVHSLGMQLVVEGVEKKWQYERLKTFQCDSMQGYYFGKPTSGEEISSYLKLRNLI